MCVSGKAAEQNTAARRRPSTGSNPVRVRHRRRALPAVSPARLVRLAGAPDGGLAAAERAGKETAPGPQEQEVQLPVVV